MLGIGPGVCIRPLGLSVSSSVKNEIFTESSLNEILSSWVIFGLGSMSLLYPHPMTFYPMEKVLGCYRNTSDFTEVLASKPVDKKVNSVFQRKRRALELWGSSFYLFLWQKREHSSSLFNSKYQMTSRIK